MYSSKDPSSYQHCEGEGGEGGGVSGNDDESSNKVMETAYRCVKIKMYSASAILCSVP